jgi:hypothetical protein
VEQLVVLREKGMWLVRDRFTGRNKTPKRKSVPLTPKGAAPKISRVRGMGTRLQRDRFTRRNKTPKSVSVNGRRALYRNERGTMIGARCERVGGWHQAFWAWRLRNVGTSKSSLGGSGTTSRIFCFT